MADITDLIRAAKDLTPDQIDLLVKIAEALKHRIKQRINKESDIITPVFSNTFLYQLLLYHATSMGKFSKKHFEYAFCTASRAAGRIAEVFDDPTNPGTDVKVGEVSFSLKTEAAKSVKKDRITISKLMEARWIRECRNQEDCARETTSRVASHLRKYQRILCLRALQISVSEVEYELIEIPRDLLLQIEKLLPSDFSTITRNGTSKADVYIDKRKAFTVRLDGSVEKITISNLELDLCFFHAAWLIPHDTLTGSGTVHQIKLPTNGQ